MVGLWILINRPSTSPRKSILNRMFDLFEKYELVFLLGIAALGIIFFIVYIWPIRKYYGPGF